MVVRDLLSNYHLSLETIMIRKTALLGLDYWFDEDFNVIEEYDLFIRISFNWKLSYVDKVLAKWRIHDSSLTWTRPELFFTEKELMIKKYRKEN